MNGGFSVLEVLGIIGLVLAVLDFTGWSHRLEKWLDNRRYALEQYLNSNLAMEMKTYGWKVILYGLALGCAWFLVLRLYSLLEYIFPNFSPSDASFPWMDNLTLVPIFVMTFLTGIYVIHFSFGFFPIVIFGPLTFFYKLLVLLNKPHAGTVGTISLLLAFTTFFIEHFNR